MPPASDIALLVPELWLAALGLVLLGVDLFVGEQNKRTVGWVAVGGLLLALVPTWGLAGAVHRPGTTVFFGSYAVDGFAVFFKFLAIIATTLVILASMDYFRASGDRQGSTQRFEGEFYTLLVFTSLGLVLMAASADLILVALSIEFVSLTSYVLAAYLKGNPKSNEAGLKYFLFGAAASAVMFYGFSLLYGLTGSTSLYVIAEKVATVPAPALTVSLALMLAGFGFKISMVPFHQWTPDVYEGAPTPVAAFLSVGSKAAGFAVLLRVVAVAIAPSGLDYVTLIAGLSAVSMFVGNLLALPQRNIKRMLGSDDIPDYAGLSQRAPGLAFLMALFMLSLTGIPPTAGFFAKFYIFAAAIERSPALLWLVAVGVVNSVISLYYYVNVIRTMYLLPPQDPARIQEPAVLRTALWVTGAATLLLGLYPQPLITFARAAALLLP